jgi:pimeloyl-ACP methyl ester carboxylesterase
MLLANKEKIDGYISIAGAGENIAKVISRQVKTNLPRSSALADSILSQLKKGKTVKVEDQNLAALFHPSVQPYLISWMAFEPQEEIKKLQIPVLILQGNTDLQVMVKDAENLRQAKPNAKYYIIDGMNHVLKNASSDRNENLASYNNPLLAIDLDLCAAIIQFCK